MENLTPGSPQPPAPKTLLLVGSALVLLLTGLIVTGLQGFFSGLSILLCLAGVGLFGIAFLRRSTKNFGYLTESMIYSIFVIGSMAVFFLIVRNHPVTIDATRSKLFSLSLETRTFLRERLDRTVRVTVFARENERGSAGLLLSEYTRHSPMVQFQLRNPFTDDLEARRFASTVVPGDTFVEILTTGTQETERVVRINRLTEEEITNAIVQLLRGRTVNLYFLTGHGQPTLESQRQVAAFTGRRQVDDLEVLTSQLRRNHIEVASLPLDQRGQVPADASVVVSIAPQRDMTQSEFEAMRAYLDRGGRALFFFDPEVALGGEIRGNLTLYNELLEFYGLSLPQETVVMPLAQRGRRFRFEAQVVGAHPITRLDQDVPLVLDQARPVITAPSVPPSALFEPLIATPAQAARVRNDLIARALVTGRELEFTVDAKDLAPEVVGAAMTLLRPGRPIEESTRLVVMGSGSFLGSSVLNQSGWLFFQNSINWLTDSGDLIAIPSPAIENTPLNLTPGTRHVLFIVLVLLVPSVIGITGTLLSLRRRGVL